MRAASPGGAALRHRDTTCTHVADTPRRARLPSPTSMPSRQRVLRRCRCTVVSTDAARRGDRLALARTAPPCVGEASSAHRIADAPASPTHVASPCHAALRRVGKPAPADAPIVGIGHRQTRRTRCARGAPGSDLTWSSQRRTQRRRRRAFRDRHAERALPTREHWRLRRARPPKKNRPHWAAGSGVAMGGRLSGRRPRAVRRTRPATAVRSTARHRPLPAPGSSLRRRRPR